MLVRPIVGHVTDHSSVFLGLALSLCILNLWALIDMRSLVWRGVGPLLGVVRYAWEDQFRSVFFMCFYRFRLPWIVDLCAIWFVCIWLE